MSRAQLCAARSVICVAVPLLLPATAGAGAVVTGVAAAARVDGRRTADLALRGREDAAAEALSQVLDVGAVAAEDSGGGSVLGRDGHYGGGGEEEEGEELGHLENVGWFVILVGCDCEIVRV
ncbi:hypothetical protein Micbo1qcDRAFT_167065 [Microdochium bolleyi]|uniref:Uncharacterized protein n=1 Tax=Microdochium bolleyi TaxID=196109 RepID=A0A136ISK6_9PEZI|nr:hypothetical protein Micbo1qcDRAFT_167065 [Microdochium bolleyi]